MKVAVCIKHVPDPDSERTFADGALVREEDDLLNELDEHALQAAVEVVQDHGGEVIAVTMGPEDAHDSLLSALQRGADRAILLSDPALAGSDVVGTALALRAVLEKLGGEDGQGVDMVFCSVAASDSMTGMFAPALAGALDWPCLTFASQVRLSDGQVRIQRWVDGRNQVLGANLPVVVSVTDQVSEPAYPNFQAITAANSKPLETWDLSDLDLPAEVAARLGGDGSLSEVLEAQPLPAGRGGEVLPMSEAAVSALAQVLRDNS